MEPSADFIYDEDFGIDIDSVDEWLREIDEELREQSVSTRDLNRGKKAFVKDFDEFERD